MLGFAGYSNGDYFDPDYTPHWRPEVCPAESAPVQADVLWGCAEVAPTSEPPTPTADSERALHQFSMIVDDVASRRGLAVLLRQVHTELGRLRPGGSWTSAEVEAAGAALLAASNAIDLWTVMEERYFGDA